MIVVMLSGTIAVVMNQVLYDKIIIFLSIYELPFLINVLNYNT